jgi:hypothetical protein
MKIFAGGPQDMADARYGRHVSSELKKLLAS